MKYDGQNISSNTTNLTIDFRASNNSANILNCLKDLHTTKKRETKRTSIAKSKIFYENGAIYISMLSNLCDRPLKFLIDTGASITLIANDIIRKDVHVTNYTIKLFGVVREASIRTQGTFNNKRHIFYR